MTDSTEAIMERFAARSAEAKEKPRPQQTVKQAVIREPRMAPRDDRSIRILRSAARVALELAENYEDGGIEHTALVVLANFAAEMTA